MDRKSFTRLRLFSILRLLAWPLFILPAGTVLTAAVVTRTVSDNAQVVQERAQHAVDGVMVQVDTLLQRYRYGLIAVRGVIAITGADRIDRATFLRYSQARDYAVEFPGARGFGFIRRVAPEQFDAYLATQRSTGWPGFTVHQFQPHRGERAIIELIEPIATNRAAIGLDIASEPVRWAGAAAASASGAATLTAPIALVQDSPRRRQSFLLLLPVYAGAGSRTVIGWAFAPLAIDAVLDRMPGDLPDGAFTLTDRAPGSAPVQFYATATGIPAAGGPAHGTVHRARRVLGRDWTATFQPSQAFVAALRLPAPRDAGLAGGALTLLAAAVVTMLAAQRARRQRLVATVQSLNATLERQVATRTGELEAALRENDVLVRTINDQMLYSVTDAHGIILEVNDNFCAAYGYRRDALIGVHYSFLSSGQHDRTFWADMRDAVMAGRTWNGTVCNQAVDGTPKWFDTVVAPYFNQHGVIERYVALHTDVTARHAVDVALRESTQRAEQASIAKSQFVANMSHEIRTPMNAMLGMLELTLRTELSARQRDYVDKARSAGATLLALLNDVLDFSKIDAGKLELDCQAFVVDGLLGDLAAVLSGNHVNQDVEVMFDIAAAIPARLHGDCRRLVQVMVNLAGNALKFTQAGTIIVGIAVRDARTFRFSVSDTGIGIPAGQLDMIFDGFTQAEASTARRFGGTGLGLAISARIVALMGGKLEVASVVGEGSRFWFDIVLATATDETVVPPALAPRRALVVASARSGPMLQRLVERTGVQAVLAHEASAASVLAAACDVVLMDADSAAADYAAGIALPLILLTAHAGDALRAAWPECVVLGKPVTPAELRCALSRVLAPPGMASLTVPSNRPRRLEGLRLLVVEDNALNRQVAFELLASEGAQVDLADGGQQGVEMATDPARTYDAIIMDVQMPDIDGIEATHRIRAVQKSAHLPIMAMTANASTADRDACLAAGMNSHIGKPFDIDEVVARVRSLVERHGTPPPRDVNVMAVTSDELIDLAGALPRFLDDAGLYTHLLGNFERESGELLARLEREQAQGDARAEAATLHALKGMALTMGAQRLARDLGGPEGRQRGHAALRALTSASVRAARAELAQLATSGASSG